MNSVCESINDVIKNQATLLGLRATELSTARHKLEKKTRENKGLKSEVRNKGLEITKMKTALEEKTKILETTKDKLQLAMIQENDLKVQLNLSRDAGKMQMGEHIQQLKEPATERAKQYEGRGPQRVVLPPLTPRKP